VILFVLHNNFLHIYAHKGSTWHVEQDGCSEYSYWNLLSLQLLHTADYYMEKYKHPIVLVLDQVDRIAKSDPKFLGILQDFAKDCADRGTLVIVFIASKGLVPQIMKCRDMIFNIMIYMQSFY